MTKTDDIFNIRPGRVRNPSLGRELTHIDQVLLAAKKTGNRSATKERAPGFSSFGRGRIAYGRSRLFSAHRRVLIKARISRQTALSKTGAPMAGHLAYLKRDGVTRDHEPATMFDAANDRANDVAFAARCEDDRHHFRFIISPEDAAQMTDLRAFTRDLTRQMERDLGTRLDWVAVDHWNTDNPHVHLIIRGVDDTGADLVMARDYISNGLRSRAEDLVAIELGPKAEHDIRSSLEREINAQRWTRLDRAIKDRANEQGDID
ncbi:MAG: type VI secretion protein, partial [Methylocystaceae bacterium]|nr:type VI secretion protein [Methylocystaceae bacterium]